MVYLIRFCVWLSLSALINFSVVQAQPVLTATSPTINKINVPLNTNVSASFSQPLAPSSTSALKVFSNQRGGLRSNASTTVTLLNGNQLDYRPRYPFYPGEVVQTTITTSVQGVSGARLLSSRVFQFTTATSVGGGGNFIAAPDVPVGPQPYIVVTADIDNDGDIDFLTPNFNGSTVSVELNNGRGTFTSYPPVRVGSQPRGLALADIDGDGDLDILTANYSSNTASVRFNDGNGFFSGSTEVPVGGRPQSVSAGDIDGDGDLDMLVSSEAPGEVTVCRNNGAGVFTVTAQVPVVSFPFSLTMADVDNDGDLDFIAGNYSSSSVSVRLNDGAGSFGGGPNVPVSGSPRGVTMGDLDGDGDLDLIAANVGSNAVSVRLNDGRGTFSGATSIPIGMFPGSVATADIDGDGDLDILATNIGSNTVSIILNNGNNTFTVSNTLPVGSEPYRVAAADLDNDGDLDLLVANFASSTVSVRLNQPALFITGDSLLCVGNQGRLTAISATPVVSYLWSTGATTASIAVSTPGLYTVTATFNGGVTYTAQRQVRVINPSTIQITGDSIVCLGNTSTATLRVAPVLTGATYRWNTGATSPSIQVSQPGRYTVAVSFGTGCSASPTKNVTAGSGIPMFQLGRDTTLCIGSTLLLTAPVLNSPSDTYRWSDGSGGRTLLVSQAGQYTVEIVGKCASSSASRQVSYKPCLEIPNIITPNGDKLNDRFKITGLTGTGWKLEIYNRWGRQVYGTDNYQNEWGSGNETGIYYYLLRYAGTSYTYRGWLEVVR